MDGLNKVFLVGTLGSDAEVRDTNSGPLVSFRVATDESYFDKRTQQRKQSTEWHSCFAFGDRWPKLAPYLVKGKKLHVEGSLQTRSWDKDGVKHQKTEIRVTNVILLDSPRGDRRQAQLPGSDDDDFPI